ncbi:MAG: putative bifunctional diguanylate cyclase/phosphodiesterase, partial [Casimicrobiaceae bacterium]
MAARAPSHDAELVPVTGMAAAPPMKGIGLLTKLNLLAIGLIVATAIGVSALLVAQQVDNEQARLRTQGVTIASMLAELSAYAVYTADVSALDQLLQSLDADRDIAYAAVLNDQRVLLASRGYRGAAMPPAPAAEMHAGAIATSVRSSKGHHYLELVAPIAGEKNETAPAAGPPPPAADAPIGYVRLGMNYERDPSQLLGNLIGALSVVLVLTMIAILATLLLTRRLVAPIRELMRAANRVGGGELGVQVIPTSGDELGLLMHAFNRMTQRLSRSQTEVTGYQRTLEEKVVQRTKELEVAIAQAYKLAQHDILTGLPNRALLNQRLKQILAQAARDHHQVACLFLDFDHFKRINDTLGHDAGDRLLQAVAQRLSHAVRESDTVARLGGDEFVVILPDLDPERATIEIMAVLTRVRESFLAPFRLGDQTPTLTCSIGVSIYPTDASDPSGLIRQADTAMYSVKDTGRNTYRFYTADMNARVQARLQIETDMRRGLMDDEFFLVYQPQIEMASGRACG